MAVGNQHHRGLAQRNRNVEAEAQSPRVLDAVVEELRLSRFRARRSEHRLDRRFSSLIRFSLTPCTNFLTNNRVVAQHRRRLDATTTTTTTTSTTVPPPTTSAATSPDRQPRLPAGAAAQGMVVSMPETTTTPSAPARAAVPTTTTTNPLPPPPSAPPPEPPAEKTASLLSGTTTTTISATSSKPGLKTRKSASQLVQRLSPWSASEPAQQQQQQQQQQRSVSSGSDANTNNNTPNNIIIPGSSKLRSVSSSDSLKSNPSPTESTSSSFLRRLSPGLAARVKLLDGSNKSATNQAQRSRSPIGKIPEEHIQELDRLHKDLSIKVTRRGRGWAGRDENHPATDENAESRAEDTTPTSPAGISPTTTTTTPTTTTTTTTKRTMTAVDDSQTMATDSGDTHGTDATSSQEPTDFEKYMHTSRQAADGIPPPPPPKDSPPSTSRSSNNNADGSYFNSMGLRRTESIYSFSRVSFSNQLSQLTSISLPQPSTLEATISSISTAPAAVRALTGAAEQIQKWIDKASDVLSGLDAEDDVEWAAAGGREGLDEVDKAVSKFESLVNIYVQAIENVQLRGDIADVGPEQLNTIVAEMESTLKNWTTVKSQLNGVKEQVELAMEWEELWSAVLGDVGLEIDNLSRLVFEMEEKRHRTVPLETEAEPPSGLDINELETIVEETPANGNLPATSRLGEMAPVLPAANSSYLETPAATQNPQDESSLLSLFARMQPLRASLDFLPMRLSMFESRAEKIFPSACEELEDRKDRLEKGYKKLEGDAESLRRELGEDRWIIVFRNAGKQAHKMCESVERSVSKLQEAIDGGIQHNNPAALAKRAENFEAKKVHYGSAIDRVLFIIQKGVSDRLTVNGEIIRLHADLKARYDSLQNQMQSMDSLLDELSATKSQQQLRDSLSSIVTLDSPATRSAVDTPESSPASSVITSAGNNGMPNISSRRSSAAGSTASRATTTSRAKRYSGLPQPAHALNQTPNRSSYNRASTNSKQLQAPTTPRLRTTSPSPTPTPRPASRISASSRPADGRPPWNPSANTRDLDVGHNYKTATTTTTPSPHHRRAASHSRTPGSVSSSLPVRSPLSRESSASPAPGLRPPSRLNRGVTGSPAPDRGLTSPTPPKTSSIIDPPPYSKLRRPSQTPSTSTASTSLGSATPRSRQSYGGKPTARQMQQSTTKPGTENSSSKGDARPGTSLGHSNRRSSLLPQPKGKSGRDSSLGPRPPWR